MSPRPRQSPRNDRAVVLILVLWVIVLLSLMVYSLLFQISSETTITATRKKQLRADALARGGVGRAIIDLRNDMIFDGAEEGKAFDAEGDVWARPEEDKQEFAPSGEEEDGYFNVRVYDEESLLNLNALTSSHQVLLQTIIERIGYNEEDAKLVAAAIIDWKDTDTVPLMENPIGSDEGRAYAIVMGEDEGGETDIDDVEPLIFRNEDYMTVDELMEVYGVTPELFFGPGTPEAEYYTRILGGRRGERFEIDEGRIGRRDDDEPIVGLRDYFTVFGNRTLNLNTAPLHVLAAFAEATGTDDGDRFAERVIRQRRGGKDEDIDNTDAFKTFEDLSKSSELQGVLSTAGAIYPIGITSTTFRIVSEGVVGDVHSRMDVLVYRQMMNFTRNEDFEYMDRARERMERNSGRFERRKNRDDDRQIQYPYVRILQVYNY